MLTSKRVGDTSNVLDGKGTGRKGTISFATKKTSKILGRGLHKSTMVKNGNSTSSKEISAESCGKREQNGSSESVPNSQGSSNDGDASLQLTWKVFAVISADMNE